MTNFYSIFHQLQNKGSKAVEIFGLRQGFEIDSTALIAAKFSNRFHDPLPVLFFSEEDAVTLSSRAAHLLTADGLPIDEDLEGEHIKAFAQLANGERFQARIPARHFGIECQFKDGRSIALLIEAIKEKMPGRPGDIPYQPSECADRKIIDCKYWRTYFLQKAAGEQEIQLDGWRCLTSLNDMLNDNTSFTANPLPSELLTVTAVPDAYGVKSRILWEDIYEPLSEQEKVKKADHTASVLELVWNILWVLHREPHIVTKATQDLTAENRWRRARKQPTFSPIHIMTIDKEALRRIEFRRAEEISTAIRKHGKYSIPGLVLVGGYDRASGNRVEDYARCENKRVRREATQLLREKDYEKLAALLNDFGNQTTRKRLRLSPALVPRMV